MDDDIAFASVVGELFSICVFDVAFFDGRAVLSFFVHFGGQGFLVGVFYFQVILFVHGDVNYISISIYIFSQYLVMLSYMKPPHKIEV